MLFFWVVTPCGLIGKYQRFGKSEISGSHSGVYEDDFWDVAPYNIVEFDQDFKGAYCLHHQGDRNTPEDSHLRFGKTYCLHLQL
jgi:hypothetical protein